MSTEVLTPGFYQRLDNYANGKKSVMSGHDGEMKNANDGDIYIYQNSMSCVNVAPVNSGLWLKINMGNMFIDSIVVMLDPDCCSTYISLYKLFFGTPKGVITPNQIPLTTIVTYLQKCYRSRISNHWATIPACSVVPPIYKQSKKIYCHISF